MLWTRRALLGAGAGLGASLAWGGAQAQSGGLLAKLRAEKSVKVGMANQMPYAMLNPDGTLDGVAPKITKLILERIGIPKIEPIVVGYGELVPGLQAGRWDMTPILAINKARCEQVQYSDPITFDSAAIAYVPGATPAPPKTLREAGERDMKVGVLTGSYLVASTQAVAKDKSNVLQFKDIASLVDGLLTKRVDIGIATVTAVRDLRAQRNNAYEMIYPVADDPPHGSAPAFRKGDRDFFDAFQGEMLKMRKSGEAEQIIKSFNLVIPPGGMELTGDKACQAA